MARDKRDDLHWIVVELSYQGEAKIEEGTLEESLRQDLDVGDDFPIFIPASSYMKNGNLVTLHLMQGYIFLGNILDSTRYFALEREPYINNVLSEKSSIGMRTLSVVPNSHIKKLRKELQREVSKAIETGSRVEVLEGRYESMEAEVLSSDETSATLLFKLRSREIITTLPKIFLKDLGVEEDDDNKDTKSKEFENDKDTYIDIIPINKEIPKKRPTASYFYESVVLAIGENTGFKSGVGVAVEIIQDRALELAGIPPEESPWPLRGRKGLYRRIQYAFRNQREGYTGNNREVLTKQDDSGIWSLTKKGALRAKELAKKHLIIK